MTNWIKCSEKKPANGEYVIATDSRIVDGAIVTEEDWWIRSNLLSRESKFYATHWMELPKPPEIE